MAQSDSLLLRVGMGYPLQSEFNLRYIRQTPHRNTFGFRLSHNGFWSKLPSDIVTATPDAAPDRIDAMDTSNGFGIFGTSRPNRHGHTLEGRFGYDMRYLKPYGTSDMSALVLTNPMDVSYVYEDAYYENLLMKLGGGFSYGDTFTNLDRLNFRVNFGSYITFADWLPQHDIDFGVKLARMPHRHHGYEVTFSERGAFDYTDFDCVSLLLAPRYVLNIENFKMKAGLDARYLFSHLEQDRYPPEPASFIHSFAVTPALEASLDVAHGAFIPRIEITSSLIDNSPGAHVAKNPFIYADYDNFLPMGWQADLRAGFSGTIADVFTYDISGGASWLRNYPVFVAEQRIWVNDGNMGVYTVFYDGVTFRPQISPGMLYTAGVELAMLPVKGFSARLAGNWNMVKLSRIPVNDLPKYDATLELSYLNPGNRFRITAAAHLIGDRKFMSRLEYREYNSSTPPPYPTTTTIYRLAPVVDVSLKAEVRAVAGLWFFVEGRNLANQRLYPYWHYRGVGANVMAGLNFIL